MFAAISIWCILVHVYTYHGFHCICNFIQGWAEWALLTVLSIRLHSYHIFAMYDVNVSLSNLSVHQFVGYGYGVKTLVP